MTAPAWLRRHHGETTRAAQFRVCSQCQAPIITGLDADVAALAVRVDPTPLDEVGEAKALLSHRSTYDLVGGNRRKELHPRNQDHVAKPRKYPVLPQHRCGESLAVYMTKTAERTTRESIPDRPPF